MKNIYYIVPVDSPELETCLKNDSVVESSIFKLRKNLKGDLCVIKTKKGFDSKLKNVGKAYSHSEIRIEMAKPEWTAPLNDVFQNNYKEKRIKRKLSNTEKLPWYVRLWNWVKKIKKAIVG